MWGTTTTLHRTLVIRLSSSQSVELWSVFSQYMASICRLLADVCHVLFLVMLPYDSTSVSLSIKWNIFQFSDRWTLFVNNGSGFESRSRQIKIDRNDSSTPKACHNTVVNNTANRVKISTSDLRMATRGKNSSRANFESNIENNLWLCLYYMLLKKVEMFWKYWKWVISERKERVRFYSYLLIYAQEICRKDKNEMI